MLGCVISPRLVTALIAVVSVRLRVHGVVWHGARRGLRSSIALGSVARQTVLLIGCVQVTARRRRNFPMRIVLHGYRVTQARVCATAALAVVIVETTRFSRFVFARVLHPLRVIQLRHLLFIVDELTPKSWIGTHARPFRRYVVEGALQAHASVLHQVGNA